VSQAGRGPAVGDDSGHRLGRACREPGRWRAPRAVHDPGKIVADLAAAVALGGDCLADIAVLRELAGPVASDPVVSRLVSRPGCGVIVPQGAAAPGAQAAVQTDIDGHRFTAFRHRYEEGQLADLELASTLVVVAVYFDVFSRSSAVEVSSPRPS